MAIISITVITIHMKYNKDSTTKGHSTHNFKFNKYGMQALNNTILWTYDTNEMIDLLILSIGQSSCTV